MYQFIKSFIPSKSNERKQQENKEEMNEAVEEAKQEVATVEDMEFDLSMGINQTSGTLTKLEEERDKLFKSVSLIQSQLEILSGSTLTEQQQSEKEKLEKVLQERVKPSVDKMDKEIDILTQKLLDLHHKRDILTQKKVAAEDAADNACKINTPEQTNYVPFDTISNNNNNNNNTVTKRKETTDDGSGFVGNDELNV